MNRALWAFILEAPVFAVLGFGLARFLYVTPRGIAMNARTKRRVARALDWLGQGRRLVAVVVSMLMFVLAGYGYTYQSSRAAEENTTRETARAFATFVTCVGEYVADASKAQKPRTAASVAANNARYDWDRGTSDSPEARGLTKAELKARYVRLYRAYLRIQKTTPLPVFDLSYCRTVARNSR